MSDLIGKTISHYLVLEQVGQGGMGVVYKAQDTKLDRVVALKFLPDRLNASEQDKMRFIQEAKAASSLNHPNVCTIHDIQEHEGKMFIVMEYVDGHTLREKVGATHASPLPIKQAIDIGIQIADGLAAAHEKGIVHRDIKPENIMIRKDGIAQIMDFGLAKLRASGSKISRLTKEGSTIGTAGYMSPEQVQGQDTDHRSDIFSYGVLLYELFTGTLPFRGVHETALAYEIVNVDPAPMSSIKPDIDPNLDAIVLDCLEKDARERTQSVAQVSLELKRFRRESSRSRVTRVTAARPAYSQTARHGEVEAKSSASGRRFLWPGLAIIFALISVLAFWNPWRFTEVPETMVMRFPITLPLTAPLLGGASTVAVSPDGKNFVYVAAAEGIQRLYLRPIDRFTAQPMAGTDGASDPFFSPDGQWIAFFSNGKLKKVSIFGGSSQDVCSVPGYLRGGWWAPDDNIWYGQINSTICRVAAKGGTPIDVTRLDSLHGEISHRFPQPISDGKWVLFTVKLNNISTFDDALIVAENTDSHERKVIVRGGSYGRFVSTGHVLYARGSSIYAVPFDPQTFETKGPPLPVEEGGMLNPLSGDANFAVSNAGTLIYAPLGSFSGIDASIVWFDRKGIVTPLLDTNRAYGEGSLSPDGQRLALTIRAANDDIWVYQINRGTMTRLTFGGGNSGVPVWTPDGKRVIYASERESRLQLFSKPWDGSGKEEKVSEGMNVVILTWETVSPDGNILAFGQDGDIWSVGLKGGQKAERLMKTPADEFNPSFSPDGRWLLYISDESGQNEVYVIPFPRGEGKYQISTNGAQVARWQADGKKLIYLSGRQIMEVDVTLSPAFDFSPPRKIIDLPQSWTGFWDMSSDGSKFVIGRLKDRDVQTSQVNIVVGWFDELKRKFAVGGK